MEKKLAPFARRTIDIKGLTHQAPKRIDFVFSLKDMFVHHTYALLSEIKLEYIPIIQSTELGYINVVLQDSRMNDEISKNIIGVRMFTHIYQTVTLRGVDWTLNKGKSPYTLEVNPVISGVVPGAVLGRLRVIPTYRYENNLPMKMPPTYHAVFPFGVKAHIRELIDEDEEFNDLQATRRYGIFMEVDPISKIGSVSFRRETYSKAPTSRGYCSD
ncbi:protein 3 [paper mulberry mosaic associated virus]|uniref:Protein 3 n=1 Tax=paper mulberry mosaic associated virus TaxID=3071215 RepID=A0AAE7JKR9_9RHAB|nr:protein 3 [paper mulberry mosaic associated virus]QNO38992.1 protein 3 [paper mulberry mosaic associated virus]